MAARKSFLFNIMSFSRAPDFTYLSAHDEHARKLVERRAELEKTKEADEKEWERAEKIKQKREELAGANKAALEKILKELRALEDVLDGKAAPADAEENEKGKGIVGSILKLLGGK